MKLKINNINYVIKLAGNNEIIDISGFKNAYGCINYKTYTIRINKDMNKQGYLYTLIHELTHAYLHEYGFSCGNVKYTEELMCEIMARYGETIIINSKKIMKELNNKEVNKKYD